jgi:hypothetical protein
MNWFWLPSSPLHITNYYEGGSDIAWQHWYVWQKPQWKSMASIFVQWAWWGWWSWVIWANSAAWWGGGWGWWACVSLWIPLSALPDVLYISCWNPKTGAWLASYVAITPAQTIVNGNILAMAWGWWAWWNASVWTWWSAGAAWGAWTSTTMPLWWMFITAWVNAWAVWIAWWAAITWAALSAPQAATGQRTTWWTGGWWLPAAAAVWTNWWQITWTGIFPTIAGSAWGSTATTPPLNGTGWIRDFMKWLLFNYWGTWWGSTHWSATGAWLVQANGWNWAPWCGWWWMGWALTGSTPGTLSKWWAGFVLITCY